MRNYRSELTLLTVLVLLLTLLPAQTLAAKSYPGTIVKDKIFFRTRASTSSGWSRRFNKGDKVDVLAIEGDFYKVRYNQKTGYVMRKFVSLSAADQAALEAAYTTPKPTATPKKTATPKPTATPKKTATPKPTATPKKTATPKPTATPKKTATPKPTATPKKTATPKPTATPYVSQGKTENLTWFDTGKKLFKAGATFQVKDVATGKVWTCRRLYAGNHLDAEPLTAADTAIMKAAYGGRFTYVRRPVLVKYGGHVYAASMYGVPHGDYTIKNNNFDGQFCIHFTGSKTSGTNRVDGDHQAAIQKALKAAW